MPAIGHWLAGYMVIGQKTIATKSVLLGKPLSAIFDLNQRRTRRNTVPVYSALGIFQRWQ